MFGPKFFSTSAKAFINFIGFKKSELPRNFLDGVDNLIISGGRGEQIVGEIKQVNIKSRDGNPVHKSHFNPADTNDIISVRLTGEAGTKTFHVYEDGTATSKKGDSR